MRRRRKRLGEMLVEAGLLTEEKLQKSLGEAKKKSLKLGQYLIRYGGINESQIVDAVSRQLRLKKYIPGTFSVDPELSKVISADLARRYQVAPLEKRGSLLKVAMVDPTDLNSLDAIELETNCEVEPLMGMEQDVNTLISALYGHYTSLDGILEDVSEKSEDILPSLSSIEDVEVSRIQDMVEEAPVVRLVNSILSQAINEKASDVHISPEKEQVQVRFRVDGKLQNVPAPPRNMFLPIVSRLKLLGNMDIATSRIPQDGRFTIHLGNKEINVRASTMPTIYGENMVMRLLDMSAGILSLDDLGITADNMAKIEPLIHKPYGMILSTGPTGSGKSTTLYSILHRIIDPTVNIITLEDPVEYRVDGIRQVQLNRRAGMTFAGGLRAILRQDPDVIMVGEIRDAETANIAVQAALTGHRVLSTVHTNDAAGAVTRLMEMGIESFLVTTVMLVSIAQRLVRKICPYCIEEYRPPEDAVRFFGLDQQEGLKFRRGGGCFHCMESGYKGRIGIYEVLVIDDEVQDMIMKGMTSREITRTLEESGTLRTLKHDAADKILQGHTTIEEAASAVMV